MHLSTLSNFAGPLQPQETELPGVPDKTNAGVQSTEFRRGDRASADTRIDVIPAQTRAKKTLENAGALVGGLARQEPSRPGWPTEMQLANAGGPNRQVEENPHLRNLVSPVRRGDLMGAESPGPADRATSQTVQPLPRQTLSMPDAQSHAATESSLVALQTGARPVAETQAGPAFEPEGSAFDSGRRGAVDAAVDLRLQPYFAIRTTARPTAGPPAEPVFELAGPVVEPGRTGVADPASDLLLPLDNTQVSRSAIGPPTGASSHVPTGAGQAEIARSASAQIAQGVAARPGAPVEIALNPEELGRVRMVLAPGDSGLTMSILAERHETMDLLRRHIEQLAQDFRDLGFDRVRFSFSTDSGHAGRDPEHVYHSGRDSGETTDHEADHPEPARYRKTVASGLDLRL
jgi:hypothetical protein